MSAAIQGDVAKLVWGLGGLAFGVLAILFRRWKSPELGGAFMEAAAWIVVIGGLVLSVSSAWHLLVAAVAGD